MRKLIVPFLVAAALVASLVLPAAGSASKPSPVKQVSVADHSFKPTKLKVRHGTKVVWKWIGVLPHNVKLVKAPKGTKGFSSKVQSSGTYSHLFAKKGSYRLECTIHRFFMTVTVS